MKRDTWTGVTFFFFVVHEYTHFCREKEAAAAGGGDANYPGTRYILVLAAGCRYPLRTYYCRIWLVSSFRCPACLLAHIYFFAWLCGRGRPHFVVIWNNIRVHDKMRSRFGLYVSARTTWTV